MQRVAVARALVNRPSCILADEPTGNLDSQNSERVFEILRRLNEEGHTVIIVTHNNDLAARTNRRITIRDGVVVSV
jgi:ABC-type lipoprotein export system ATPase subunit